MKNNHCPKCQNRTKLFIKTIKGMTYVCKNASICPFIQKKNGEKTKLDVDSLQKSKKVGVSR